jgi:hypothetical protein
MTAYGLRLATGGEIEFLLAGTLAKFINKKFIVYSIAQQSFFSPELLFKDFTNAHCYSFNLTCSKLM